VESIMVEEVIIKAEKEEIVDPISEFIEKRKAQCISLLSDLIRQNTVNPPGNEAPAAKVVTDFLDKLKVKYELIEPNKSRVNVMASIGAESGKKVLFSAHLDTVPPGEGWDTDPFEPTVKGNLLFGRGACDNKGQAASMLLVLEYLKSIESTLRNRFIFIFAADEETGSSNGLKYLLAKKLVTADYAIIPDTGGEMKQIDIAEKGILNIKITSLGKQAHGATPHKGINAITNMSKLLTKLDYYTLKYDVHKYLSKPTINIGTVQGGSAPNMVPARCESVINIRHLPSQTPERIIEELKVLGEKYGVFEFETLTSMPPTEVDDQNILVKTIQKISLKHGIESKPYGLNGATDAKSLVLNGVTAVGYDFSQSFMAHTANESCNLDDLFLFSNMMIEICLELDGAEKL
jgi:succinyl-diaminopimelate desuccinylase